MNNQAPKTYSDVTEGSAKNIFIDPNLQKNMEEDPIYKFFANYWRPIVVTLVGIGAIWYSRTAYLDAIRKNSEEFAGTFVQMQSDFTELKSAKGKLITAKEQLDSFKDKPEELEKQKTKVIDIEKNLKEVENRLNQELVALQNSSGIYKDLGTVYSGLVALNTGDIVKAKEILGNQSWKNINEPFSKERIAGETGALAYGRYLLQSKDTYTEGKTILKDLAEKGSVVQVASAITLSSLAKSDEEKAEALILLQGIKERDPIQGELVDGEINRLSN